MFSKRNNAIRALVIIFGSLIFPANRAFTPFKEDIIAPRWGTDDLSDLFQGAW
jgi:hypothetical protein